MMLAPSVISKHGIFQLFPNGHVFTALSPQSNSSHKDSHNDGSDQWCILELTEEATRGVGGVYATVGDCGSLSSWLGECCVNSDSTALSQAYYSCLLPLSCHCLEYAICVLSAEKDHDMVPVFSTLSQFLNSAIKSGSRRRKDIRRERKRKRREKQRCADELAITTSTKEQKKRKIDEQREEEKCEEPSKTALIQGGEHSVDTTTRAVTMRKRLSSTPDITSSQLEMQMALQSRLLRAHSEVI